MSVNAIEPADAQPVAQTQNSELIYRLEDRPPLLKPFCRLSASAGHVCRGNHASAVNLPGVGFTGAGYAAHYQHVAVRLRRSLYYSNQSVGPVGSGLLSIQGTSFNFVAPLIMGGTALKTGGADVPTMMAALFGTLMLASCTEMVLSRILHLARRIITPLVSGVVVMIIGLSLIQVGLTSIGGGYAAMSDNTFGAPKTCYWPASSGHYHPAESAA